MTDKPTLTDLTKDLAVANQRLLELEQRESVARNETTDQRNRVNTLQKQFDAAVVEVRNAAARETDWGQRRRDGQRADA